MTLSRVNFSGYIGDATIFIRMLTTACCFSLFHNRVTITVRVRLSVWSVSGYAHVFVLLCVVILALSSRFVCKMSSCRNLRRDGQPETDLRPCGSGGTVSKIDSFESFFSESMYCPSLVSFLVYIFTEYPIQSEYWL